MDVSDMKRLNGLELACAAGLLLLLFGCGLGDQQVSDLRGEWNCPGVDLEMFQARPGAGRDLWVTSTEGKQGHLQQFDLTTTPPTAKAPIAVSGDAVVRRHPWRALTLVLNRFGADNIQFVDENSGESKFECSVGLNTNLKDAVFSKDETLYVSRHSSAELMHLDLNDNRVIARIDLSRPYSDEDGIPESNWMTVAGDRLYVALQRLNSKTFATTDYSSLIAIDLSTDRVAASTELRFLNPEAQLYTAGDRVYVGSVGGFPGTDRDSGIESFRLPDLTDGSVLTDETRLGGNILAFDRLDANQGVALISVAKATAVVSFNWNTGTKQRDIVREGSFVLSHVQVDQRAQRLYVADRSAANPAIRAFDMRTLGEVVAERMPVTFLPIHFALRP